MKKNPNHTDNLVALRQIEGQIRGVQKMVSDRKYCIEVQLLIKKYAARTGIPKNLTVHTLQHCFATHLLSGGAHWWRWNRGQSIRFGYGQ